MLSTILCQTLDDALRYRKMFEGSYDKKEVVIGSITNDGSINLNLESNDIADNEIFEYIQISKDYTKIKLLKTYPIISTVFIFKLVSIKSECSDNMIAICSNKINYNEDKN